jgi:hypothetical protein
MKNIFFISLQRAGSNYVEVILNKNTTEDLAFRGYLLEISKHFFPQKLGLFKLVSKKQDAFIIITKNPYMWVESICFNNEMDKETQKELWLIDGFEEYKVKDDADLEEYNLFNIVTLYKDFYTQWLNIAKERGIQIVKYEDFLYEDKAKEVCKKVVHEIGYGQVKSNFKLHDKPIRFSKNFTKEDFEYYKNENPTKISKGSIDTITSILGADFIEELGYEVIS